MLATPPESVAKILKAAEPEASIASWAVRFAADLDGVITVLSGMSSVEQMKDNLSYMKDFHGLSDTQKAVLKQAPGGACPHSADPVHHLQLLCKGLSDEYRNIRFLYSYELSDALWR